MTTRLEVEMKFPVDSLDGLRRALRSVGARTGKTLREEDIYLSHPNRDFARTDEALRVRRVGQRAELTYKGPKLDATTKTRREIELPLADAKNGAANAISMLEALGFLPVAIVRKKRREYAITRSRRAYKILVDEVDGLGTFVEIETIADARDLDGARDGVLKLASDMGLESSERRSYLELLLPPS